MINLRRTQRDISIWIGTEGRGKLSKYVYLKIKICFLHLGLTSKPAHSPTKRSHSVLSFPAFDNVLLLHWAIEHPKKPIKRDALYPVNNNSLCDKKEIPRCRNTWRMHLTSSNQYGKSFGTRTT